MSDRTPEQKIADASRVEQFLRDDVIRHALERLEEKYIEAMVAAKESAEVWKAQGKIHAVRGFAGELTAIIEGGVHEAAMKEMQSKFDKQKKKGLLA